MSTGKNVQKWTRYFPLFFRRVRATSMSQRRVENTRVHFWTFSPVTVKNFFLDVYSLPESFGLNEIKSGRLSKRSSYFLPAEQKKAGNVGLDWSQESNDLL